MVGLSRLRAVPQAEWGRTPVLDLLDAAAETVTAQQSVADAEEALRRGPHDYLPVVEAGTHRLVGVVSGSDIQRTLDAARARHG
jgi:CBS domain-containing protein